MSAVKNQFRTDLKELGKLDNAEINMYVTQLSSPDDRNTIFASARNRSVAKRQAEINNAERRAQNARSEEERKIALEKQEELRREELAAKQRAQENQNRFDEEERKSELKKKEAALFAAKAALATQLMSLEKLTKTDRKLFMSKVRDSSNIDDVYKQASNKNQEYYANEAAKAQAKINKAANQQARKNAQAEQLRIKKEQQAAAIAAEKEEKRLRNKEIANKKANAVAAEKKRLLNIKAREKQIKEAKRSFARNLAPLTLTDMEKKGFLNRVVKLEDIDNIFEEARVLSRKKHNQKMANLNAAEKEKERLAEEKRRKNAEEAQKRQKEAEERKKQKELKKKEDEELAAQKKKEKEEKEERRIKRLVIIGILDDVDGKPPVPVEKATRDNLLQRFDAIENMKNDNVIRVFQRAKSASKKIKNRVAGNTLKVEKNRLRGIANKGGVNFTRNINTLTNVTRVDAVEMKIKKAINSKNSAKAAANKAVANRAAANKAAANKAAANKAAANKAAANKAASDAEAAAASKNLVNKAIKKVTSVDEKKKEVTSKARQIIGGSFIGAWGGEIRKADTIEKLNEIDSKLNKRRTFINKVERNIRDYGSIKRFGQEKVLETKLKNSIKRDAKKFAKSLTNLEARYTAVPRYKALANIIDKDPILKRSFTDVFYNINSIEKLNNLEKKINKLKQGKSRAANNAVTGKGLKENPLFVGKSTNVVTDMGDPGKVRGNPLFNNSMSNRNRIQLRQNKATATATARALGRTNMGKSRNRLNQIRKAKTSANVKAIQKQMVQNLRPGRNGPPSKKPNAVSQIMSNKQRGYEAERDKQKAIREAQVPVTNANRRSAISFVNKLRSKLPPGRDAVFKGQIKRAETKASLNAIKVRAEKESKKPK